MSAPPSVVTEFGEVSVDELARMYTLARHRALRSQAKRLEWLQTDDGKEYNRGRAKAYYQRHKEAILEKRKETYAAKKELDRQVTRYTAELTQPSEGRSQ